MDMAELVKVPLNGDVADTWREHLKTVLQSTFPDATVKIVDDLVVYEESKEPTEQYDGFYHKVAWKIAEIRMR